MYLLSIRYVSDGTHVQNIYTGHIYNFYPVGDSPQLQDGVPSTVLEVQCSMYSIYSILLFLGAIRASLLFSFQPLLIPRIEIGGARMLSPWIARGNIPVPEETVIVPLQA